MFPHLFSHTGNHSVKCEVCSYEKMGYEELLLWTSIPHSAFDTEFPFSIMLLLLNVAGFSWPGFQDPL